MQHLVHLYTRTLIELFTISNPIITALYSLSFSRQAEKKQDIIFAGKITLNILITTLFILFVGDILMKFLKITLPFVQISGGLLIFSLGWTMLNKNNTSSEAANNGISLNSAIFYPITMPFTIGGGAIAVILSISTHIKERTSESFLLDNLAVIAGLITVSIIIGLSCYLAPQIKKLLKESGVTIFLYAFSLVLLPLGLLITWSGLKILVKTIS